MNHLEEFLKMCDKTITTSNDEKIWSSIPDVGMEEMKVSPMFVKESDDPCAYDTVTGEFIFINNGGSHES